MTNIPNEVSNNRLKLELANILHIPPFRVPPEPPVNFEVFIFQKRKNRGLRSGALTFPDREHGHRFLQSYGGLLPQRALVIGTTRVQFRESDRPARPEVVDRIRSAAFQDPREAHAREQRLEELRALQVHVSTIQFGWECRDQVYSVEWETACDGRLVFDGERREFHVEVEEPPDHMVVEDPVREDSPLFDTSLLNFDFLSLSIQNGGRKTRLVVIRVNQICWVSASEHGPSQQPMIFFSLIYPPSFQSQTTDDLTSLFGDAPQRQRWSSFSDDHVPTAAFTSLAIRLVCRSSEDLYTFKQFACDADLKVGDSDYLIEHRGLFSRPRREEYARWLAQLPWTVAFQVEALLRSWLVDITEILLLRIAIEQVLHDKGTEYTAALLRDFYSRAKALFWYGESHEDLDDRNVPNGSSTSSDIVTRLFNQVCANFVQGNPRGEDSPDNPFDCLHVIVTPTTFILEGPFPERSNRVMRTYHRNHQCFLRVMFQDENRLQFRFDREVDGRSFINRRVKRILLDGFTIAGAHFDFLAYSQSALKEHAVWFVTPFEHVDENGISRNVNASSIIADIGNFRDLPFDRQLIYCPARYAARLSQAFTATDASISVEVSDVIQGEDIKDATGTYAFTDGVGTISPQLAKEIWRALKERRRRGRQDRPYPRAYQIRFQGSKGMLSVDYTLPGRTILLRPSMIKFEAPHSNTIEIARAFDRPAPYYLNRPLIMLLEGLGVPYDVFQSLQDEAVRDAKQSVQSLERSGRLLEGHGLGTSFRLTSVMLSLHKLGVGSLEDAFWRQMMDYAINHVLRELKHHARIPVPGQESWTLVGVADVHEYLDEGEVLACVDSPDESEPIFLQGPILISRSPTIHPGDVQVVHAIGRPPPHSPYAEEPLPNTVVFSIRGMLLTARFHRSSD